MFQITSKNWRRSGALLLALGAFMIPAHADGLISARGEVRGKGDFTLGNSGKGSLREADVNFARGGFFTLQFDASKYDPIRLVGRWTRISDEEVRVQIVSSPQLRGATGSGTWGFTKRGNRWEADKGRITGRSWRGNFDFYLDGSEVKDYGGRWDERDEGDDGGWGGGNGGNTIDQLFSNVRGNGFVRIGNSRNSNLRDAEIALSRGGNARIELRGDRTYVLTGRWIAQNRNRIRLEVSGLTSYRSSGSNLASGTLSLSNGAPRTLSLSGRLGDERISVSFSAR